VTTHSTTKLKDDKDTINIYIILYYRYANITMCYDKAERLAIQRYFYVYN